MPRKPNNAACLDVTIESRRNFEVASNEVVRDAPEEKSMGNNLLLRSSLVKPRNFLIAIAFASVVLLAVYGVYRANRPDHVGIAGSQKRDVSLTQQVRV